MSATLFHSSTNEYITALESVLRLTSSPVRWLLITHDGVRLPISFSSRLRSESAAILQVSQDKWAFDRGDFVEMVEWALSQGQIENLVLVGTSQAVGDTVRAALADPQSNHDADSSYGRLVAGVKHHAVRTQRAQKVFSEQFQHLMQIPVVHSDWREGSLDIYGLFYREESGVFLQYDFENDDFVPLLSSVMPSFLSSAEIGEQP